MNRSGDWLHQAQADLAQAQLMVSKAGAMAWVVRSVTFRLMSLLF
jgi:hypothetical protein